MPEEHVLAEPKQVEASRDKLLSSTIHLLHRAGQSAGEIYLSEMAGADLTPRQYAVLVAVSQNEGLSQTQLVNNTGIDRSTLADIIRRMLKKDLLQRRRTKDDARAYSVNLTESGAKVLADAQPLVSRVDEKLLGALPSHQRERFLQDLNLIITSMDAAVSTQKEKLQSGQ